MDIIKIVELLEKSGLLIHRITETENYRIKKQTWGFATIAPMAASLTALMAFSLIQPVSSHWSKL